MSLQNTSFKMCGPIILSFIVNWWVIPCEITNESLPIVFILSTQSVHPIRFHNSEYQPPVTFGSRVTWCQISSMSKIRSTSIGHNLFLFLFLRVSLVPVAINLKLIQTWNFRVWTRVHSSWLGQKIRDDSRNIFLEKGKFWWSI